MTKEPLWDVNDLIVTGEVKAGEQVVAAGASYLVDGQQVKILTE